MQVNLEIVEEKPVGISLPEQVVQEVIETEAVVKGQTASSSYKPAILKNGLRVMVPPHIEVGVKILVSTLDCTYTGKHKL
jgi:elongation factor P